MLLFARVIIITRTIHAAIYSQTTRLLSLIIVLFILFRFFVKLLLLLYCFVWHWTAWNVFNPSVLVSSVLIFYPAYFCCLFEGVFFYYVVCKIGCLDSIDCYTQENTHKCPCINIDVTCRLAKSEYKKKRSTAPVQQHNPSRCL